MSIPRIFFQTSKLPLEPYIVKMTKAMLPQDWIYRHFLDEDIVHFLNSHQLKEYPGALEVFRSLKRGEHKADFFRYYFLFVKGGVFMDSDAMIYRPINEIVRDYKFFSVNSTMVPGTIFQGILGSEPRNPLIGKALEFFFKGDFSVLDSDYHFLCKQLYLLYQEIPEKEGYHLLEESPDQEGDKILDGQKVSFRHFWRNKEEIPRTPEIQKSRNLVYCCVFYNKDYFRLLDLLLKSLRMYSFEGDFDFLVITQKEFEPLVKEIGRTLDLDLKTFCLDFSTIFQAACARLFIFDYPELDGYEKLLYLDTDILIKASLDPVFQILDGSKDILYGIESGTIESLNFGGQFFNFNQIDKSLTGINSGTLLFFNSQIIKSLFQRIRVHLEFFTQSGQQPPYCMDQPFINFHAIKDNLYDNKIMNSYVSLFENNDTVDNYTTSSICHFSFPIGNFAHKYNRMCDFFDKTLNRKTSSGDDVVMDVIGKKFSWGPGYIKFIINYDGRYKLETPWGQGSFRIIDKFTLSATWNNYVHVLKFNKEFTEFISIRSYPKDFEFSRGFLIETYLNIYGDSHAMLSFKDLKLDHRNLFEFGRTMYRLGRDNHIINFKIEHNHIDRIFCLAYGEVDVRAHIGKQVYYGRHHETVCKELVEGYFKTIQSNIKEYRAIIIVGISPPTDPVDHNRADHTHKPVIPFEGTNRDRLIYTVEMNRLLSLYCKKYGYIYFNPYQYYEREDGCLNYALSDKCLHIGDTTHFQKAFSILYKTLSIPIIPVVLHTCDKYKQFWNPWFYYFKKHVKPPFKIYFLSEEEDPDFIDEVIVIKTGKGEWGERLIRGFNLIPESYIYYMQEDFWACKPIDLSIFLEPFIKYSMDALRISNDSYLYTLENVKSETDLFKFSQNSGYLMTHQFSLWDKSYFMQFINSNDDPWKNEIEQSDVLSKLYHSIYLIKNAWYNATVRKGSLEAIGIQMIEEMNSKN
jgi:lipopolysaccharide biosynthesis glycosyltransferase